MKISISKLKRSSIWVKVLLSLIGIYIIHSLFSSHKPQQEGFTQSKPYVLKKNNNLYDDFYTRIYDKLFYDEGRTRFETKEITKLTNMDSEKSVVLDIGSGTGHHLGALQKKGIKQVIGIDTSKDMVKLSKKNYPEINFQIADGTIEKTFPPNHFTHILTLYFTIYYIQDKKRFFENCFRWLRPGGYFVLHLVNRQRFNPVLNAADPLFLLDIQKYAKDRITDSKIKFNHFDYQGKFALQGDKGIFKEKFKDKSNHVRENEHIFYMEKQHDILGMAKNAGFILHGKIDMHTVEYNHQYLYIMYKPE